MASTTELRADFFNWLYTGQEGFICLATGKSGDARKSFRQKFFHWPTQREELLGFINEKINTHHIWFAVSILNAPKLSKDNCITRRFVWADLDTCKPEIVKPEPSIIITSSPGRYQALWKIAEDIPPSVAEDYSRRIAYKYKQDGADPSGWDLVQLLRVPFTINYKYDENPIVLLDVGREEEISIEEFENIEQPELAEAAEEVEDVPDLNLLPDSDTIIYKYQSFLDRSFYELHEIEPSDSDDWSARMWKLINLCFEAGMESNEVFAVAYKAKCNKYIRDNRPVRFLWMEVVKASRIQTKIDAIAGEWQPLLMPELVDPSICEHDTFIDRYFKWARNATDAVEVYHELSAAIILSAVLSSYIRLDVKYGTLIPNLWGLVLGESTLTRKTTAMQMAVNIFKEVDNDGVMATDGTVEGLLTGLSNRPGRTSIFYKDEVAGFVDAINRKDYLAGMPEMLTQLYDGQSQRRMLRKEEIDVQNPIFIFFGGGIAERTYQFLSEELILNGFLPRFLIVNGYADINRLRRTGPNDLEGVGGREKLINDLRDMREMYQPQGYTVILGQKVPVADLADKPTVKAILTQEAWDRYGDIEMLMVKVANDSHYRMKALPTFERLSRSLLKLGVLLAASRQDPRNNAFDVELRDINNAARFIQEWGRYSIELILNAGKTQSLRLLEKIRSTIDNRPGIMRSELLRIHHLSSREMTEVISTLVDRGEVKRKAKGGRSEQYWINH